MKKIIVVFLTIILSLFYFLLPISANPVIEITDKDFNFGEVLPGQVLHHTYIVKNTGTSDLIISEVNPSCGCTTALLLEKVIAPGKSVKIEADLTAQMNDGVMRKNINVVSNDPKNPTVIIYLNATVKSDFLIEPKKIEFGEMFIGEKKEFKFTVTPTNKKGFDPSNLVFNKEIFTVSQKALNPNEPLSAYEFTVVYFASPIFRPRSAYETIIIYPYKGNNTLQLNVPFSGKIKGYVEQSASSIIRKVNYGFGHKEIVNFKHLKEKPFTITSATSSNENITTNIIKISDSSYDLEIVLKTGEILNKEGNPVKKIDTEVVVKTDQEDSKDMRIYLTFLLNKTKETPPDKAKNQ